MSKIIAVSVCYSKRKQTKQQKNLVATEKSSVLLEQMQGVN